MNGLQHLFTTPLYAHYAHARYEPPYFVVTLPDKREYFEGGGNVTTTGDEVRVQVVFHSNRFSCQKIITFLLAAGGLSCIVAAIFIPNALVPRYVVYLLFPAGGVGGLLALASTADLLARRWSLENKLLGENQHCAALHEEIVAEQQKLEPNEFQKWTNVLDFVSDCVFKARGDSKAPGKIGVKESFSNCHNVSVIVFLNRGSLLFQGEAHIFPREATKGWLFRQYLKLGLGGGVTPLSANEINRYVLVSKK